MKKIFINVKNIRLGSNSNRKIPGKNRGNSKRFRNTDHGLKSLDHTIFDQKSHHWIKNFDHHREPS